MFINKNKLFNSIPEAQKVQINMILRKKECKKDDVIWDIGESPAFCFFVYQGKFEYEAPGLEEGHKLELGNFVGDFKALTKGGLTTTKATALEDSVILIIIKEDLSSFLIRNPGLFLLIRDKFIIT